jgi:hypothetical protein
MEDIRVDKTMVNGKAEYKAININKSASQDDTPLVPGGKLLDLGINMGPYTQHECLPLSQRTLCL